MRHQEFDFNGKCILVTGAAGFVGSNLCHYFQKNFAKAIVVAFDRFRDSEVLGNGNLKSFGHFKNLDTFRGIVVSGDITNPDDLARLFHLYRFDYIFHEAAISDTTATEQGLVVVTNVNAFDDILRFGEQQGATIVYASSAAVYGSAPSPQMIGNESPANVYGFSKLMMDNLAQSAVERGSKVPIVGLRYFNVYGSGEFYKNKTASTVLQFGLQILGGKRPKLFEKSESIFRDFVFIEDVIQANVKAAQCGKSGVFNVGTGVARTFMEIAELLQAELGIYPGVETIPNPFAAQYQFHTQADISKTCEEIGYSPEYSLDRGIRDYVPTIRKIAATI